MQIFSNFIENNQHIWQKKMLSNYDKMLFHYLKFILYSMKEFLKTYFTKMLLYFMFI